MTNFTKKQVLEKIEMFRNWLDQNGAQVLEPTNAWELIRFKTDEGTGIIYANAKGETKFTGPALDAWTAFKGAHSWRAAPATKRKPKSPARLQAIRERDGGCCFYCLLPVAVEDESEEHLVPITHQGPNHISNIFLAHKACNQKVGHLSAPEKIALHVKAHMKKAIA